MSNRLLIPPQIPENVESMTLEERVALSDEIVKYLSQKYDVEDIDSETSDLLKKVLEKISDEDK